MVITYGTHLGPLLAMYQSTQSNPELCFILVPNWKKLEGYSLEKILKPVNHPTQDLKFKSIIDNLLILTRKFCDFFAFCIFCDF